MSTMGWRHHLFDSGMALYHSEIVYSRPWFNLDPDLDVIRYDPPMGLSAASRDPVEAAEVACPLEVVLRR